MLIEIGSSGRKVQHLPIGSLRMFGTNLYGDAIFRVVWSESRYYLVGGNHVLYHGDPSPDKTLKTRGKDPNVTKTVTEYRWLPLYPSVHAWILEKWVNPISYTGCTREQYDNRYKDDASGLLTLGPYPERGEYVQSFTFPSEPTFSTVQNLIYRIRAGWNYTYKDHVAANKEKLEKEKKARGSNMEAIFKDSQQAFNNKPSNIRPGKRTKEKIPLKYTAEEIGQRTKPTFYQG